ncbi:hypothetical protein GALL_497650 [mine drainage metagenome]|uniref:Uncharacterized protein n=1 Tax=mine drainage metagenome TaxID=410659 RepID=A0A1J5PLI2_9ZZZZ
MGNGELLVGMLFYRFGNLPGFGGVARYRLFYINIKAFFQGSYSIVHMRCRRCSNVNGVEGFLVHQVIRIAVPIAYTVPQGIVSRFFCIAAHYGSQAAAGNFIKCRAAFFFSYIAAAYYPPVDCGRHIFLLESGVKSQESRKKKQDYNFFLAPGS